MQVYLLRHGVAEEARIGASDAGRALTPYGRRKLRQVLKMASEAGVSPTLVLSSPLKRAMQTAQIAREVLGYKSDILRTKALAPGASANDVWEEIRVHQDEASLLLVGHNPLFSELAAYLLGDSKIEIDFKKGAIFRVDLDNFPPHPKGILRWYLTARLAGDRR